MQHSTLPQPATEDETRRRIELMRAGFRAYIEETDKVAVYPGAGSQELPELAYLALGLAGETGEAVDVVKKMLRLEIISSARLVKLHDELGDVAWYFVRLCAATHIDPVDVLLANVYKLRGRQAEGTLKERGNG